MRLPVRTIPKVTAVAKPSSIVYPVIRFPIERRRSKASALKALVEQEASYRIVSRFSAEAAVVGLPVSLVKVTPVAKPASIVKSAERSSTDRRRWKASVLKALVEPGARFRISSGNSAVAVALRSKNVGDRCVLICPCSIETCADERLLMERNAMLKEDPLVRRMFESLHKQ